MWEYEDQTGDCSRSPEGLGKEEGVSSGGRGKAEKRAKRMHLPCIQCFIMAVNAHNKSP